MSRVTIKKIFLIDNKDKTISPRDIDLPIEYNEFTMEALKSQLEQQAMREVGIKNIGFMGILVNENYKNGTKS